MVRKPLHRHYIKEWRQKRGYSLRRLETLLETEPGVPLTSHANLNRIENRLQPYTQEILEALSVALQASPVELLTVNPLKDGEVVDLLDLMRNKDKATIAAILRGLPDTGTDSHN